MKSSILVFVLIALVCFAASFITNMIYHQTKRQARKEIIREEIILYSQSGISSLSQSFYRSVHNPSPTFKPIIMDLEVHSPF